MKKIYTLTVMLFVFIINTIAQGNVGIGTNSPDNSAILDITSTDKGLLMPRVSLSNVATFGLTGSTSTAGMLVYNTNASTAGGAGVGFYYWTGSVWTKVVAGTTASLNNGQLWIGNASNAPAPQTISGDATISNTGVLDLNNGAVETSEIADGAVTTIKIVDNAVEGNKINITGNTNGSMMYYNGSDWVNLAPGTAGQILQTNGAGAPIWVNTTVGVKVQNGANISTTAPNASAADPYVELGGALVRPTTVSALTATNKMSFTGTGVDMFNVDGTTLSVDGTNDRIGIGTTTPTQKLQVEGSTLIKSNGGILNLQGSDHGYIQWYPQGGGTRKAWTGYGSSGAEDFTIANEVSGKDIQLNTTGAGNTISNHNFIATEGLVTGKIQRKVGPGTGSDNTWHTVELDAGYGGTAISVYATGSYMDGEMKMQGMDISNLLSTTVAWYRTDVNNAWNSTISAKNQNSGSTSDNVAYMVYCPNGYIATGWEAYASLYIDNKLHIRCTKLANGYTTIQSNEGIESVLCYPQNASDNIVHVASCPAGTFIKGISVYVDLYFDGPLRVNCTGIKRN